MSIRGDNSTPALEVEKVDRLLPMIDGWEVKTLPHKTHRIHQLVRCAGDFEFTSAPIPAVVVSPNFLILLAKQIEKAFKVGLQAGSGQSGTGEPFEDWKKARLQAIVDMVESELSLPIDQKGKQ